MSAYSTYLKQFLVGMGAMVAMVAATNAFIDPYGLFRIGTISGLNETKARASQRGEIFKRQSAELLKPKSLILGNSLAEIGFDPEYSAWPTDAQPAFNFALPGTGIQSALKQLKECLTYSTPQLVLVGLNFPDFRTQPREESAGMPLPQRGRLQEQLLTLVSLDATMDSMATVKAQRDPYAPRLTYAGFNPMLDYVTIAQKEGYHSMFAQRNQETAKALEKGPKHVFFADGRPGPDFNVVREMVTLARSKNIRLIFVIYPYHVDLLTLFDRAGLWPAFDAWKRELVNIVAKESGKSGKTELWDFSGLSAFSAEAVPDSADRRQEMRWYWEAGHFKKALGDKVLDVVLRGDSSAGREFGILLTQDNIEQELPRQRLALMQYFAAHAPRTQSLSALLAKAANSPNL